MFPQSVLYYQSFKLLKLGIDKCIHKESKRKTHKTLLSKTYESSITAFQNQETPCTQDDTLVPPRVSSVVSMERVIALLKLGFVSEQQMPENDWAFSMEAKINLSFNYRQMSTYYNLIQSLVRKRSKKIQTFVTATVGQKTETNLVGFLYNPFTISSSCNELQKGRHQMKLHIIKA